MNRETFHQLVVDYWHMSVTWVEANLLQPMFLLQSSIIIGLLLCSIAITRRARNRLLAIKDKPALQEWKTRLLTSLQSLTLPIIAVIIIGLYAVIAEAVGWKHEIITITIHILIAWLIISSVSLLLGKGYFVRWIKMVVLALVALHAFDILDPTIELLESMAITIGKTKITIYSIIKGITIVAVLLWASSLLSSLLESRIHKAEELSSSHKVLFSKLTKILLFTLTAVIGLNAMGLNLTALTIFGGAIGVGLGFGLQKVVSNFISGIILLLDRSIKPGDVIAIGDTYGWVNSLGTRYVSVITRDGKEHLIPNELLITDKVENWSFTNNEIRLRIPIGVSYNTDIHQAIELIKEAASKCPRVLETPKMRCLLRGFGDSSVDLELRVWIDDPVNGMANIQSDILLNVWDIFKEHNIEIPFPQRDVHIHNSAA